MAVFNVDVEVDFLDAAGRTSTRTYRLAEAYDDASPVGFAAISAATLALEVGLSVLSMSEITRSRIILNNERISTVPNAAANNQVVAFSRVLDSGGNAGSITVPAWDDVIYDQNEQNVIGALYDTAVGTVTALLKNPETGLDFGLGVEFSQSRTRKSRNIIRS